MSGIDVCLYEVMALPGARGAALVDWTCGLALGSAGEPPCGEPESAAVEAAELARMSMEYGTFRSPDDEAPPDDGTGPDDETPPGPGATGAVEDLIVTTRTAYHLLRFVETGHESSVFLHLWLDRDTGNLAVARLCLRDAARRLVLE
ncbi:hypothetical protein [Streptomyces spectabilis]|uniref:Roadblock/LC7 domain-containing protein n=1 Tax=Streptomyces spectabilis TaxID=68270 RepID=A0A516R809_STRST|nr:hypothetical protein [Streptomyces spectabilis]QDQ11774.1 hypothetical protein FH965_15330 [Streptomyces spectabilis]